ncbi:MAG: serine/threonine-protein kinase [Vicinamibacterales bacterium]
MAAHPFDLRATDARDTDATRHRVRLFLQVMLGVDLIAYVSDYVSPLVVDGLTMPDYPLATLVWRYSSTAIVASAWGYTRFGRPGPRALVALDAGITLWLTLVYIQVATSHMTAEEAPYAPIFVMFGLMLLLSVRAALVPSSIARTAAVGAAAMALLLIVGRASIAALAPRVLDGLTFIGGAFVVATAVTSHVIYGLRREVQQARRLGQYTLERKLGEGGMGAVYRARHALLRRQAAIKLVRPELTSGAPDGPTALQRFEREAHVTAGLRSPHTVELYDFGIADDGACYYVMELLDGINLEVAVARYGPMPAARVAFLLRQVCESLQEAHAAGLVHRDIKPANIFLCRYGLRHDFVKVLDFGLVALESGAAGAAVEGGTAGTPAYLAPETITSPDRVDARADIYGIGCVAYWLLTGRAPFERPTARETILAHVNDTPTPPSRAAGISVPAALEATVLACRPRTLAIVPRRPTTSRPAWPTRSTPVPGPRPMPRAGGRRTSPRPAHDEPPAADEMTMTVVRG